MVIEEIDLERGETISGHLVGEIFDTAFTGGINKRFDPDGDPFIVLFGMKSNIHQELDLGFKNQDETRFRYIGAGGMQQDQSLDSPRNKMLLECIDENIPVFFFLRRDGGSNTYYGRTEVIDYTWEQAQGQRVVVFDLEFDKKPDSASLSSLMVISGSAI